MAVLVGRAAQRIDVLGEAAAAVAGAGIEEAVADARVGAYALPHQLDVGAHAVGQVRQLVHEADAGGQHGVGRVLGELRAAHVHHAGALVVAVEGQVQLAQGRQRALASRRGVHAQHDAVGPHEVVDRRAFLQEFGIARHREVERVGQSARREFLADHIGHLLRGAHRHGGLVDHHLEAVHVAADVAGRGQHVLQVGAAVLVAGRADGDVLHVGEGDAGCDVRGEGEAAFLHVAVDDFLEAGLVDRHSARIEQADLGLVDVQAEHVVAQFRQAGAGDQAHVAGPHDRHVHRLLPRSSVVGEA
jgi:hypothetical protein